MRPSARARERLRLALDTEGWTQRELAKRLGKSQPWLQKILNGENAIRLDNIDAVARAIGVPPAELIREGDDELMELTPSEQALLRSFRALADPVKVHAAALLHATASVQASDRNRHQRILKSGIKRLEPPAGSPAGVSLGPSDPAFLQRLNVLVDALADLVSGKTTGNAVLGAVRPEP